MSDRVALLRWLLAFMALDLVLGGVLVMRLLQPRSVVIVPGVREEQIAVPGAVPGRSLANFALLFALNYENFTPATVDAQDRYALELAAPGFGAVLQRTIAERKSMVREASVASSLFPDLESMEVEEDRVRFRASKRHTIGERVSWEARFEYTIGVQRIQPTASNPYGLAVSSLVARKLEDIRAVPD